MAQTFTIDARPHIMGNLTMITGTFTNAGGSSGGDITLADHFSKILAAGHNANAASAPVVTTEIDATVNTTITIVCGANIGGTWWAIGNR